MESFFRYISYLGLWEEDKQLYTAGYVRWKYQQGVHRLEVQVKDPELGTKQLEMVEEATKEMLGVLSCTQGYGEYKREFFVDNEEGFLTISGKKIHPSEIQGIEIRLEKGRRLKAKLELPLKKENIEKKNIGTEDTYEKKSEIKEIVSEESNKELEEREGINFFQEKENRHKENPRSEKDYYGDKICSKAKKESTEDISQLKIIDIGIKEEKRMYRKEKEEVWQTEERKKEIKREEVRKDQSERGQYPKIMEPMKENKWEQLCKKYEIVYPFSSEQKFIILHLKDFIILQEGYQKLVHNSFLLHGYYSYGHLILGRLEQWEESPYYIGVPGVYYENEKRAAKMFGFAGFEGASKIIENGSYGYYMIEVKI